MPAKSTLAAVLIAVLAVGASVAPVSAGDVHIRQTLDVRSGPGSSYRVVDRLHVGDAVDVRRCVGEWCYIWKWGCDGWVHASHIWVRRKGSPGILTAPWIEPFLY